MLNGWQWLAGTYWYVPDDNLPAALFSGDPQRPRWLSDQTVWQITGYENGYFWGNAAVRVQPEVAGTSEQAPAAQYLAASVTPEGDLHLTFMPLDASKGSSATVGIGRMRWRDQAWTAEMQMSSPPSHGTFLLHWAHMVQCTPDDAAWQQLPGTSQSLPSFLASAGLSVTPSAADSG